MSRCTNCGYMWADCNDERECCHYDGPDAWAPCEQDESEYEIEHDYEREDEDVEFEYCEAYDEDYEREDEARADFIRYSEPYDGGEDDYWC